MIHDVSREHIINILHLHIIYSSIVDDDVILVSVSPMDQSLTQLPVNRSITLYKPE